MQAKKKLNLNNGWAIAEYGENEDGTPKFRCLKRGSETIANFGTTPKDICDYILNALIKKDRLSGVV